jgi:hypothetical protein
MMWEAKANPVGPGDELRNLSTKTLRPRRRGPTVSAFAVFVLVALVAVPGPPALAQPSERPKPQELWREFPLEQTPSRELAPEGSSPTSPRAEDGDGSFANLRTLAIAVTVGLLLLLLAGVLLAQVSWAQIPLGREARRWRTAVATNGQKLGFASRAGGRSLQSAAAQGLRRARRIAADVRRQTIPARVNELTRLREMLVTYVARRPEKRPADEHVEKLKAKLDVEPTARAGTHPEVEILKAKRGEPDDLEGPDEAEMLKAKFAENVVEKAQPRRAPGVATKQRVSR